MNVEALRKELARCKEEIREREKSRSGGRSGKAIVRESARK